MTDFIIMELQKIRIKMDWVTGFNAFYMTDNNMWSDAQ